MTETQTRSYSQYDEQAHILAAFPEIEGLIGRFLDIGAFHPTDKSNTRALYERGWSGVMVEPSPQPMLNLLAEYGDDPRITLICAAVGIEPLLVPMHITADAVSTSSERVYEVWKDSGSPYIGKMLVPAVTLEQIQLQFGSFEFVNLDAEGHSADLFIHMLNIKWHPHCVCVEHDDRLVELAARATQVGYKMPYSNGTNAVFVR